MPNGLRSADRQECYEAFWEEPGDQQQFAAPTRLEKSGDLSAPD